MYLACPSIAAGTRSRMRRPSCAGPCRGRTCPRSKRNTADGPWCKTATRSPALAFWKSDSDWFTSSANRERPGTWINSHRQNEEKGGGGGEAKRGVTRRGIATWMRNCSPSNGIEMESLFLLLSLYIYIYIYIYLPLSFYMMEEVWFSRQRTLESSRKYGYILSRERERERERKCAT